MTRNEKLAYHLEMVIWNTLPEGTRLNASDIGQLMAMATEHEHGISIVRGCLRSPYLLGDELCDND